MEEIVGLCIEKLGDKKNNDTEYDFFFVDVENIDNIETCIFFKNPSIKHIKYISESLMCGSTCKSISNACKCQKLYKCCNEK